MATRKPTPTNVLDDVLSVSRETEAGLRMLFVPLRKLEDNPYQTRQANDQDHVLNLAQSIVAMAPALPDTKGLQQVPLGRLVRWGDGASIPPADYDSPGKLRAHLADGEMVVQLAFGHSRRLAFVALAEGPAAVFPSLAGTEQVALNGITFDASMYAEMPVILTPLTNEEMWRNAITENAQRKDISAIEEAIALRRAMTEFGMTGAAAARDFGWARSTAANKLRLLDLPEDVQQACMDGKITERHARELCRLIGDDKRIADQFAQTLKKGWSVSQLKSSVDWNAEAMKKDQAKAAEIAQAEQILAAGWTPPGCNQPLPADRLDMNTPSWNVAFLPADNMPGCSPDCPCMKLLWHDWGRQDGITLSQDTPHLLLACTNPKRREEIAAALDTAASADPDAAQAATERRRQAEQEIERKSAARQALRDQRIAEATQAWQDGIAKLDKLTLWGSLAFWRTVTKNLYSLDSTLAKVNSEREAMDVLLARLFERCEEYDRELKATVPDKARVITMLASLAPSKRKKVEEAAPEEDLQAVVDRLQALSAEAQQAHAAQVASADEAFGIAAPAPVSQETPAAPIDWTQLPADLVAAGWTLEQRRGKWYAAIEVETEEKPIETTGRESIATTIQDAMFLHKSLQIGA